MVGVEEYAGALASNGYTVRDVAADRVDTKLGHVIVVDALRIDGEWFEAEPLLDVFDDPEKDHPVEIHGIDVHSRPGHELSSARESLLDECATTRDEMGEDWVTWTYHAGACEDNVDDLLVAYRDVFDHLDGEVLAVSPP